MASYFFAFSWGIVILLSLIGWGSVLNRLLFRTDPIDWGQRGAWGLASSVVVGGGLNLLGIISRTTILLYLGSGLAGWLIVWLTERRNAPKPPREQAFTPLRPRFFLVSGILLASFLILIRYAASVSVVRYDAPSATGAAGLNRFYPIDDFQAYFIFPEKMIQTGSMGSDPFCARRLESSLGGQSFLETFVLSALSIQHIRILESGLAVVLVLGLLWGGFKEKGASVGWAVSILLVFLVLGPEGSKQEGWGNITSYHTSLVLFLSLGRTLGWKALPTARFLSRTAIVAVIGAAICSLKSSRIPACGIVLACSFFCYLIARHFDREAVLEFVSTVALVVAFMLPWMIAMHQSSGTLLYPLLGRGYHQSVYGNGLSPYSGLTFLRSAKLLLQTFTDPYFIALGVLGIFYLASRQRRVEGREPVLSLMIGAVLGLIIITLATQGISQNRQSLPFLLAAVLMLIIECASRGGESLARNKLQAMAPLVAGGVALFLVGSSWTKAWGLYLDCFPSAKLGLENVSLVPRAEVQEYEKLQQSVPAGEVILTKLDKPFLLDFKRNTVLAVDWVEASPPPGLPLFEGSEALARYLRGQSIRYVAYSYGAFGNYFSESAIQSQPVWFKSQLVQTYDFQNNVVDLGRTRKHVYDDGTNFVLDLIELRRE